MSDELIKRLGVTVLPEPVVKLIREEIEEVTEQAKRDGRREALAEKNLVEEKLTRAFAVGVDNWCKSPGRRADYADRVERAKRELIAEARRIARAHPEGE
jgi:hypothetical protein